MQSCDKNPMEMVEAIKRNDFKLRMYIKYNKNKPFSEQISTKYASYLGNIYEKFHGKQRDILTVRKMSGKFKFS